MNNQIEQIERRNAKVEADKAWELSSTRTAIIAIFTYITALIFLISINESKAALKAIIPFLAYILSIQTFSSIKNWWIKNVYKPNVKK